MDGWTINQNPVTEMWKQDRSARQQVHLINWTLIKASKSVRAWTAQKHFQMV